MSDENNSRQAEEIEALSAIYNEDFITIDQENKIYEVRIQNDNNPKLTASLRFVFPQGYPGGDLPVFEVQSQLFTRDDEALFVDEFHRIGQENTGECCIFQWVEKLREMFDEKASLLQEQEQELKSFIQETEDVPDTTEVVQVDSLTDLIQDTSIHSNTHHCHMQDYQAQAQIVHGEPFTDRKSTFQAHLAMVISKDEVDQAMFELKLNRKIANATHNIMAYRIFHSEKGSFIQDCDDDGENAAGSRLLHLLQICDVRNVVIVVTRWYGGLLLGPDRFKHINNCARNLLDSCGLIGGNKDNQSKEIKGKKSMKTKKK